jgi:hypothetical protein
MRRHEALRAELVAQFGGACERCGYSRCVRALHFHHRDPTTKRDWAIENGKARLAEAKAHPTRFVLLCANCHIEEHDALDKARQTTMPCAICGREFPCKPYEKAGHRMYCSRACRDKARRRRSQATIPARLWKHVVKGDGCWEWVGATTRGFPVLTLTNEQGVSTQRSARRVSYELHYGPLPAAARVLVTCENQMCIRPDHLQRATPAEVGRQQAEQGRTAHGAGVTSAKLSEQQVREIRARYAAGGVSQTKLAKEFGLAQGTVGELLRRETWRHVP